MNPLRSSLASTALLIAACGATPQRQAPPPPTEEESVDAVVEALVAKAELRADLSTMRVAIQPLIQAETPAERASVVGPVSEPAELARALHDELVLALSNRVHLFDLRPDELATVPKGALAKRSVELGATHLVVGEYERERGELVLALRLVDAQSRLIVAAARGPVPSRELTPPAPPSYLATGPGPTAAAARPAPPAIEPAPRTSFAPRFEPVAEAETLPEARSLPESRTPAEPVTEPESRTDLDTAAARPRGTTSFQEWLERREEAAAAKRADGASEPVEAGARRAEDEAPEPGSQPQGPPPGPRAVPPAQPEDLEFIRRVLERYSDDAGAR